MNDEEIRRLVREFRTILREKSIYYTVVNNEKYGSVTKIPGGTSSIKISAKIIPPGTIFANDGFVNIEDLEIICDDVIFMNKSFVNLNDLGFVNLNDLGKNAAAETVHELPEMGKGIKFLNQGPVSLKSIKKIAEGTEFGNDGELIIPRLEEFTKINITKNIYIDTSSDIEKTLRIKGMVRSRVFAIMCKQLG